MKRLITSLIALWSVSLMAGLPPTTLSGEQVTAKPTTFTFETPNYQATQVSGIKSRIETGNTNLLVNPSFEHSTFNTSWTNNSGTVSADTTYRTDGKKAMKILSSSIGTDVYQTSTLNSSNLTGLQMVAMADVNTVDPLTYLCAIVDSVDTNCVLVPVTSASNPWRQVVIPYIAGTTNNGIRIKSATTTANLTTYIDNVRVGQGLPLQNVSGAKLVGGVTITGCAGRFQTTSTTFASFGTQTGCVYTTFGQAVQPSVTNLPVIKFASLPPGDYIVEYTGAIFNAATGNNTWIKFHDGTGYMREEPWLSLGTSGGGGMAVSGSFSYSTTQSNITFEARGKIQNGTGNIVGSTAEPGVIKVYYYPPESKIYSQASQDVAYQPCTFSTLAWQGLGTVTNDLLCARKGQNLMIKGKWTAGTTTGSAARIPLPTNFGSSLSIDANVKANQVVGVESRSVASTSAVHTLIISPSTSYLNISNAIIAANVSPTTAVVGSLAINTGETLTIFGEVAIPIQGWQDYGVIVGSFAGIEKCSDDFECTGEYTAHMNSSQIISNQNLEGWITGNAGNPSTGIYTIPIKSGLFTQVPNCTATHTSTGSNAYTTKFDKTNSTTSSLRFIIMNTNSGNVVNVVSGEGFVINCQKAGVDFKPKTAKVATSIGVPTVPGITTTGTGNSIDTFSFSYGKTVSTACDNTGLVNTNQCAYLDQIGNIVSNITRNSTGSYTINLGKTYSKLKCTGVFTGSALSVFDVLPQCSSCSSVSFQTKTTSSGVLTDTLGILDCKGSY